MNGTEGLKGRRIVVFYNDSEKVMRKDGLLLNSGSDFLELNTSEGKHELIAVKNIIRIIVEERA